MSKVTVYRGIDINDGSDSLFAVRDGVIAVTFYREGSEWLSPDTFGEFEDWAPSPYKEDSFGDFNSMEKIWES